MYTLVCFCIACVLLCIINNLFCTPLFIERDVIILYNSYYYNILSAIGNKDQFYWFMRDQLHTSTLCFELRLLIDHNNYYACMRDLGGVTTKPQYYTPILIIMYNTKLIRWSQWQWKSAACEHEPSINNGITQNIMWPLQQGVHHLTTAVIVCYINSRLLLY